MIYSQTGHIIGGLYVLGHPGIPVYLVDGPSPFMIDAGFACLGGLYTAEMKAVLNGRQPSHCLMTHAHFDHCGAMASFKRAYPRLQAAASTTAAQVLKRPGAIERIGALNAAAAQMVGQLGGIDIDDLLDFESFDVDLALHDGDRIDISSKHTVEVIATPGHTRDCLSFYLPEFKWLFCSEAFGQPDANGYIVTDCLQDYDRYLASMQKLAQLDVEVLCPGHIFVYAGKSVRTYMAQAHDACLNFRRRVERLADQVHGDIERMMALIKADEYDANPNPKQPEPAYLINLEARIKAVLNACGV